MMLEKLHVGAIVLVDRCYPFLPSHYEAEVLAIADEGYVHLSVGHVKVKPLRGLFKHARWVGYFQIDGIIKSKEIVDLERLVK